MHIIMMHGHMHIKLSKLFVFIAQMGLHFTKY